MVSSVLSHVQGSRQNTTKQKILLCLNYVLEKLSTKAKSFKDLERIVKVLGRSLTEAAPEVREEA